MLRIGLYQITIDDPSLGRTHACDRGAENENTRKKIAKGDR